MLVCEIVDKEEDFQIDDLLGSFLVEAIPQYQVVLCFPFNIFYLFLPLHCGDVHVDSAQSSFFFFFLKKIARLLFFFFLTLWNT